jgi:CheY-like chemotaxis protein
MWNLLSNAVKFTERGGHVKVSLSRSGSQLVVAVADDGRGIEPEFLPYVFDRFQQADSSTTRRFGGLGLGLAIVRHIVELHGGRASVRSAGAGAGATFEIVLPIHPTAPTLDAPAQDGPLRPSREPPPTPRRLDGVRVLVVDDEADARDLLEVVLSEAGAQVRSAGSASAAFAQALERTPDVIVSDIGMPDEDGYGLMSRIRSAAGPLTAVPAIALTAYTRKEDHLRALSMGFSAHVGKPVKPGQLIELVAILAKKPGR